MFKKNRCISFVCLTLFLSGCRGVPPHSEPIISMQVLGRSGFSETISNKDRLEVYEKVDFLSAQPYQKVLRVYKKDFQGKSHSKLTSYHPSGGVWQYLEAVDGRGCGRYIEWHENGKMKIEGQVIDGLGDLHESAQKSWLFDQKCRVWDEEGHLEATFEYERGLLHGETIYYFPNGNVKKRGSFSKGIVQGAMRTYDEEGELIEEVFYANGKKEGSARGTWKGRRPKYEEEYRDGLLQTASYFTVEGEKRGAIEEGLGVRVAFKGEKIYSLTEYINGQPEGKVEIFDPAGFLHLSYFIKDGKKTGEEWEYFLHKGEALPKLMVSWVEDRIEGITKTWYQNGMIESQREMSGNKKHGLSFAYYKNGDVMLMEEYRDDQIVKGSYYRMGERGSISTIEKGEGEATLYSGDGHFLKKIRYEKGRPCTDG